MRPSRSCPASSSRSRRTRRLVAGRCGARPPRPSSEDGRCSPIRTWRARRHSREDNVIRAEDVRERALDELRRFEVLMLDGHFDYGNGYHGPAYLNPHQLFRYPSTIWRLAQDLLDVVPQHIASATDVVAGPPTGGALLAHTLAGLLDSRRSL